MGSSCKWFWAFIEGHCSRIARSDWPPLDAEFWGAWESAILRLGMTEAVAHEASLLLAEAPADYLDKQLPALLTKVKAIEAARRVAAQFPDSGKRARDRALFDQQQHDITRRWEAVPEEERQKFIAEVDKVANSHLNRWPQVLRAMAIERWIETNEVRS